MRLSYYGGGHYDSVAPVDGPAPSGVLLPPAVVEAAGAASAGGAAASPGASAGGAAADAAGAVVPGPEPGQLEEAALERSRRRAAEAGSGRYRERERGAERSRAEQGGAKRKMKRAPCLSVTRSLLPF